MTSWDTRAGVRLPEGSSADQVARAHLTWHMKKEQNGKKRIKTSMGGVHSWAPLRRMGWIDQGPPSLVLSTFAKL